MGKLKGLAAGAAGGFAEAALMGHGFPRVPQGLGMIIPLDRSS
jgi:hypothetical protein